MKSADLYSLLDSAGDAAFVVDVSGTVRFWSSRAERLLGYSAEQALGRRCADLLAGKDGTGADTCRDGCRILELAGSGGDVTAFELVVRTASDDAKWVGVSILVAEVVPGPSPLVVHLMRDIEDQKRLEGKTREILTQLGHLTERQADDVLGRAGPSPPVHLTEKEMSVLHRLAQGASTADIAAELQISRSTLRNHVQHILAKLGCHSRLEAVLSAARRGLI